MESEPTLSPAVRYHLESRVDELLFGLQARETLKQVPAEASPVLDLGCGTAPLAPLFIARGQEYVGVDRDDEMLAGARCRLAAGPGRVVAADATGLPFRDDTFGAVTSLGLFEYLDEPVAALREVRRVLRAGGVAVLTVPRRDAPYRRLQAAVAPGLRALGRPDPFDLRSAYDVTGEMLKSWAMDAGLTVQGYAHVAPAVLPFPVDRVLPSLARALAERASSRFGTARLVVLRAAAR